MVLQQDQTDQLSEDALSPEAVMNSGEAGEDSLEQLGPDRTLRDEMGLACRKWKRRIWGHNLTKARMVRRSDVLEIDSFGLHIRAWCVVDKMAANSGVWAAGALASLRSGTYSEERKEGYTLMISAIQKSWGRKIVFVVSLAFMMSATLPLKKTNKHNSMNTLVILLDLLSSPGNLAKQSPPIDCGSLIS